MPENDAGAAGQAPECQTCPICAGLAALREARPEAVEHLVKAGAELLLAAKALLDSTARAHRDAGPLAAPPPPARTRRRGRQRPPAHRHRLPR